MPSEWRRHQTKCTGAETTYVSGPLPGPSRELSAIVLIGAVMKYVALKQMGVQGTVCSSVWASVPVSGSPELPFSLHSCSSRA